MSTSSPEDVLGGTRGSQLRGPGAAASFCLEQRGTSTTKPTPGSTLAAFPAGTATVPHAELTNTSFSLLCS